MKCYSDPNYATLDIFGSYTIGRNFIKTVDGTKTVTFTREYDYKDNPNEGNPNIYEGILTVENDKLYLGFFNSNGEAVLDKDFPYYKQYDTE